MRYLSLLILLIAATFLSCKTDPPIPYCFPVPNSPSLFDWDRLIDTNSGTNLFVTEVNPQNGFEILFQVYAPTGSAKKMYKYNTLTSEVSFIIEDNFMNGLSWGNNGWILYSSEGGTIWKVKSNGDSLTQVVGISSAYSPVWNLKGDGFTCGHANLPTGKQNIRYNINGSVVDTLYNIYGMPDLCFLNDSLVCYTLYDNVHIYNLQTKTDRIIKQFDPMGSMGTIYWAAYDGTNIVYAGKDGVYSTNYQTFDTKKIVESCTSKQYAYTSYSRQLHRLFFNVLKFHANTEQNTLTLSGYIVSMNTDGSDERKLPIMVP